MTGNFRIRPARPEDASGIVAAIRSGFDPSLLRLFVYGCDGVADFIADQIVAREIGGDASYTVAIRDGKVAGCIEMRRIGEKGLFLNYVSVLPDTRGTGLGSLLLRESIGYAGLPTSSSMSLDVLEGNEGAQSWYRKLGFVETGAAAWREIPMPAVTENVRYTLLGYPQSAACQRAFGFSQLQISTDLGEYGIGRMGDNWFRLTQPEAFSDPAVFHALRRIDPGRRLFSILGAGTVVPPPFAGGKLLAATRRMRIDLDRLREALG